MKLNTLAAICSAIATTTAFAWDASGHRMITTLAIEQLPAQGPVWLKDPAISVRIADQSTVPDRWRSVKIGQLQHASNPDHYFDIEDLQPYELEFKNISPLRVEFIKQLLEIRVQKGWKLPPKAVNAARDPDKTQEWPGFLPFAVMEGYGKLQSSFKVIRVLEKINDPARAHQLEQARADATVQMGLLAHFVGDAAQPLHTTQHHHGWVGDNPKGYTTERGFHAEIDGGVIRLHHIDAASVRPACRGAATVDRKDPWNDVVTYIERSFKQVEPLYELKKTGDLAKDPGKEFIQQRLADASMMLAGLTEAAWEAADPSDSDVADFKKYDGFGG
ncbi:MAG: hypothetical protein NTV94_13105 [Planctomycetota bacterium]|nr:hypothetical protein [Planctomycetota bacterium]